MKQWLNVDPFAVPGSNSSVECRLNINDETGGYCPISKGNRQTNGLLPLISQWQWTGPCMSLTIQRSSGLQGPCAWTVVVTRRLVRKMATVKTIPLENILRAAVENGRAIKSWQPPCTMVFLICRVVSNNLSVDQKPGWKCHGDWCNNLAKKS